MSHDRGCHCGKEPYEYDECRDKTCSRSPLFNQIEAEKKALKRGRLKEEIQRTDAEAAIDTVFAELRKFYERPHVQKAVKELIVGERKADAHKLAAELRMKADALERAYK